MAWIHICNCIRAVNVKHQKDPHLDPDLHSVIRIQIRIPVSGSRSAFHFLDPINEQLVWQVELVGSCATLVAEQILAETPAFDDQQGDPA